MPIAQIVLLVLVAVAVLAACGTYLYHLYRWSPHFAARSTHASPPDERVDDLTMVYDALAKTPCAVCCCPVGDEPAQRDDGRWCCPFCAGIPASDDDETVMVAHGIVERFQQGLVPARDSAEEANKIRVALRAGMDAKQRCRELAAVVAAYQLLAHRLEQERHLSPAVQKALAAVNDVERAMSVDGLEEGEWVEEGPHAWH